MSSRTRLRCSSVQPLPTSIPLPLCTKLAVHKNVWVRFQKAYSKAIARSSLGQRFLEEGDSSSSLRQDHLFEVFGLVPQVTLFALFAWKSWTILYGLVFAPDSCSMCAFKFPCRCIPFPKSYFRAPMACASAELLEIFKAAEVAEGVQALVTAKKLTTVAAFANSCDNKS